MRIIKIITVAFPLIILMLACSHSINPDVLFKNEQDLTIKFTLGDKYRSDSAKTITITKDSEKYNKLKEWIINNNNGWKSSIESWGPPDILITNSNFRLLIFKDGVVLGFSVNSDQYTRKVNIKEFAFIEE